MRYDMPHMSHLTRISERSAHCDDSVRFRRCHGRFSERAGRPAHTRCAHPLSLFQLGQVLLHNPSRKEEHSSPMFALQGRGAFS